MNYYEGSDIVIRNMTYSDIALIVVSENTQGVQVDPEKFYSRLEDQEKCKNIALVAEYNGSIAGYVYVYPFSLNGPFMDKGYSEIMDLKILEKYKNLDLKKKLIDAVEEIAIDYSNTVFISVEVHNRENLNFFLKRGYTYANPENLKQNEDKLDVWLWKKMIPYNTCKFPLINTPKYPFFKWFNSGVRTVDVRVNYGKYQDVQVNDKIIFFDLTNQNNCIVGQVLFKHEYSTTEELLRTEGVKNVLPFFNDDDIEKGVLFLGKLPDRELVENFGCIAFGVKIV